MAQPIPFETPLYDPRATLRARLEGAPEQHAEALLAAYDILGLLHERGILDLVRSGLAAGDELLDMSVAAVSTPGATRATRNLLFWLGVLGRIEPEWFQGIFQAIPDGLALATSQRGEPVNLWRLLRRAISRDSLRGLAAGVDFIESFGQHLRVLEMSAPTGPPISPARTE
jgi:uncharacterized protein YjgD (DUF1641 family)